MKRLSNILKPLLKGFMKGLDMDIKILLFFVACHYMVLQLAPAKIWVEYYKTSVVSPAVGEIQVSSDRVRRIATPISYLDILFCKDEGGEVVRTSQSITHGASKTHPRKVSTWVYGGLAPRITSECYIESEITIDLEYGIQKSILISTEPFRFLVIN